MGLSLPRTLRSRMVVVTVLITGVVVVALVLLLQVFLATSNERDAATLATARAQGVGASVRVVDGRPVVRESTTIDLDRTSWVYDSSGHLLDGTVPAHLSAAADRLARAGVRRDLTLGTDLLHAQPVVVGHRTVAVVVTTVDLAPYERAERRSLFITIALGLVTIVVAGAVAQQVGRYVLAAVHQMSQRADDWREHDLSHRFALGPPVDEITELGQTLDRLLERISTTIADERRLTDELAHELRTPLTVIRSEAQLAMAAPSAAAESLGAIIAATERLETSLRTVLDAARDRVDGRAVSSPREVLEGLGDGVDLTGVPPTLRVGVAGGVVAAVVGPLLDNARRHARSRTWVVAEGPVLHVHDDGPGVAPGDEEQVFAPGWSASAGGTGLGLAVVRRVAGAAGVEVRAVADGAGHFVVGLPPA